MEPSRALGRQGLPALRRLRSHRRAAAIVAVADSFEAMTGAHTYKKPLTVSEARAELTEGAGTQFSPEVVRAFLSISLGRLRIAMGPFAALAHIPFLPQATSLPGAVGASFNQGVASAVAGAGPALGAGLLSLGALVGTGVIDGAVAEPHGNAVFAAARLTVAPNDELDEGVANLVIAGVMAARARRPSPSRSSTPTARRPRRRPRSPSCHERRIVAANVTKAQSPFSARANSASKRSSKDAVARYTSIDSPTGSWISSPA
ncbi:MAG TPA: hypothetical protein VM282_17255 [Acidimicrobiales bacterium]|nr:hypothetical protein [Acidimicrobiales bacterium]